MTENGYTHRHIPAITTRPGTKHMVAKRNTNQPTNNSSNRRQFLSRSIAAGSVLVPYHLAASRALAESANDRPNIGCIGIGGRGRSLMGNVKPFGDIVAVCDVDRHHVEKAREMTGGKAETFGDYRKLLERDDIDAVVIATPDHWHTKISIDAMLAGKDVYCEKPLTLTIDEGRKICQVVETTKRVFQVGTQQRSEFRNFFLQAIALIRDGRIGKIQTVTASTGGGQNGGPFTDCRDSRAARLEHVVGPGTQSSLYG